MTLFCVFMTSRLTVTSSITTTTTTSFIKVSSINSQSTAHHLSLALGFDLCFSLFIIAVDLLDGDDDEDDDDDYDDDDDGY